MINKLFFVILAACIALLFGACSTGYVLPAASKPTVSSTTTQDAPVTATPNLVGEWSFTDGNFGMNATIVDGNIKILLKSGGSEGLYWDGSFPATAADGVEIVSAANVESLKMSLFGSGDKDKTFLYEDGKLNFAFTMMGVTKNITLSR